MRSPRRRTSAPIAAAASRVLAQAVSKKPNAPRVLALAASWNSIAPDELVPFSKPVSLSSKSGVLAVQCDGAFAVALQLAQPSIIHSANAFFGSNIVKRIRILQRPVSSFLTALVALRLPFAIIRKCESLVP